MTAKNGNEEWMRGLVRGHTWKARMANGAVFKVWTPRGDMSRKEARKLLLGDANRWCDEDGLAYFPEDIENLWVTKG